MFPSLIGRLTTWRYGYYVFDNDGFPSLIGRLTTLVPHVSAPMHKGFPSLIGRLTTIRGKFCKVFYDTFPSLIGRLTTSDTQDSLATSGRFHPHSRLTTQMRQVGLNYVHPIGK